LDHVLATFGLILCFDTLVQMLWGPQGMAIPLPACLNGRVTIWPGIDFPTYRLLIILVGLAVAAGLYVIVTHTRVGMRIRAGASNRTMVSALGVNIQSLYTLVFALGAVLAGLAGLMIAPIAPPFSSVPARPRMPPARRSSIPCAHQSDLLPS
jgi:branched-chain amino acid transport system permease protein